MLLLPVIGSHIWAAVWYVSEKKETGWWTLPVPAAWVMCIQPGTEHSTCSLNLFQPVSYHASVTLFTHNYILAPLCFLFQFSCLRFTIQPFLTKVVLSSFATSESCTASTLQQQMSRPIKACKAWPCGKKTSLYRSKTYHPKKLKDFTEHKIRVFDSRYLTGLMANSRCAWLHNLQMEEKSSKWSSGETLKCNKSEIDRQRQWQECFFQSRLKNDGLEGYESSEVLWERTQKASLRVSGWK